MKTYVFKGQFQNKFPVRVFVFFFWGGAGVLFSTVKSS